jgi:hypothetical protein
MDMSPLSPFDIIPVQKFSAEVAGVFAVPEGSRVESRPVPVLRLELEGAVGDRHFGFTRKSTSREPWYARGTVISNTRQVTILSAEELAVVAGRMGIDRLEPEWIGGSIVLAGVRNLSFLPLGTRLIVPGGPALLVAEQNGPCRIAGKAISAHFEGRDDLELGFPKHARRMRGLTASVERAGALRAGDRVDIMVPEQWTYRA